MILSVITHDQAMRLACVAVVLVVALIFWLANR